MADTQYRGFELSPHSIVGGVTVTENGEYVGYGSTMENARYTVDQILEERSDGQPHTVRRD